ncbi:MAG: ATP-binding protein, partial [Actinomycetota bacterium]
SFSLSLVVDGELVGLIAAHHETPRRLAHDTRSACGLVARILSEQLARSQDKRQQLEDNERLGAQFLLLRHLTMAGNIDDAVDAAADDLRRLLRADGLWCRLGGRVSHSGKVPHDDVVAALLAEVAIGGIWQTDELPAELGHPGGALVTRFHEDGWAVWFRNERRTETMWGGDPGEGWSDDGKSLTPRTSFAAWAESVRGRSEPWTASDQAIASTVGRGLLAHQQRQPTSAEDDFQHVVEGLARYAAELQMVNLDLEASNANLAEIAYVIAHDLRAPLRSIRSFLQIYKEDLEDASVEIPEEASESWEVIEDSAANMQQLLNALLEWSRVRPERLNRDIVSLDDAAESASRSFLSTINGLGGTLEIGTLGDVFGDQAMLRQVFANLFDNAIRYRSPDRPLAIRVSATRDHDRVEVSVSDDGVGIPEQAQEQVFRMFGRAAADDGERIGAGLAIVERIVEGHSGRVGLLSTEGVGTTFVLTLPLSAEGRATSR